MRKSKVSRFTRRTKPLDLGILLTITACHISSTLSFTLAPSPIQTPKKDTLVVPSVHVKPLFLSSSNHHHEALPSTYDQHLPASLRGEAVRSALRSDRGVCFDFTSRETPQTNVGVVTVNGKGTLHFLNSKLTSTFPKINGDPTRVIIGDKTRRAPYEIIVEVGQASESCLLTGKGRLIDKLRVGLFPQLNEDGTSSWQATLITSPGHAGSQLFDRLDPYVFPMDQIHLTNLCKNVDDTRKDEATKNQRLGTKLDTKVLTLAATDLDIAKASLIRSMELLLPALGLTSQDIESMTLFPKDTTECIRLTSTNVDTEEIIQITILQDSFLPQCIAKGYTLIIEQEQGGSDSKDGESLSFGERLWKRYTSFDNTNGPVELGPLEYDTLRIEGGQAGFGFEMMGDGNGSDSVACSNGTEGGDNKSGFKVKSSPLELHMKDLVDVTKGCYQGQEGIASLMKNKRGIPRTLYCVHLPEGNNVYNDGRKDTEEYSNHDNPNRVSNLTKNPRVGDKLYVLGSNEQISVGTITSVAEQGGTSQPETVGLVMVRREQTIRNKMKKMGLDLELEDSMFDEQDGMFYPPPMDGLQGLEVILEGSFTQGVLRAIPSRRLPRDQNLFEAETWGQSRNDSLGSEDSGETFSPGIIEVPENFEDISNGQDLDDEAIDIQSVELEEIALREDEGAEELEEAIKAATIAAEEAKRKAEKLEMLKERAELAMAKRKEKRESMQKIKEKDREDEMKKEIDATETKRKAEKLEMLKKQAEAVMEARRKKKLQQ